MRIEYDREADALYIRFRDAKPSGNLDVEDGLTVDFDDQTPRRPGYSSRGAWAPLNRNAA